MQIRNLNTGPIVSIVLSIVVIFLCKSGSVEGASIVRTDKAVYHQGEAIRVYFSNAPGYNSDWICIVPAGSPDTEPGDYKYTPGGVGRGSLIFDPRSPGRYEVRAYYNYRRDGYVVSGRYPFSVGSVSVTEKGLTPRAEPIEPGYPLEADLPPPIPFVAPPNVVVLPGTDVYIAPDLTAELFFQGGWWWRQWRGNWYRSQFYDHGWAYHRHYPSWHRKVPHDWRQSYHNRVWSGRPWNPPRIVHGNIKNHWRGGHWRTGHGLGQTRPPRPPGRQTLHSGKPGGGPDRPAVRTGGPGGGRPGGGPDRPAVRTGGPGGGRPGGGPDRPAVRTGGPGGGRPVSGTGSGTRTGKQTKQGHGDGSGRGDRR